MGNSPRQYWFARDGVNLKAMAALSAWKAAKFGRDITTPQLLLRTRYRQFGEQGPLSKGVSELEEEGFRSGDLDHVI
jgi:hypothetical protein